MHPWMGVGRLALLKLALEVGGDVLGVKYGVGSHYSHFFIQFFRYNYFCSFLVMKRYL